MDRRLACWLITAIVLGGCSTPALRSQSPEEIEGSPSGSKLVGDIAVPYGMQPVEIEAVSLVTSLPGTGSDPAPSPQRAALSEEMRVRGVRNVNQVLASPSTSLVLVRGYLRPGIQKGDRFDVEIRIPGRSLTSSLRDGWLMETRLKELAVRGNQVLDGHVLGLAEGPVLIDPSADADSDQVMLGRGRVLGGGVALKSRPLGLILKPNYQSVANSSQIGTALNRRFYMYRVGLEQGVATPKTDEFVELVVHPRYKDNIGRYMQVVRSVPLRESATERLARLKLLERQLFDPVTSSTAALRLEAIGHEAVDTLAGGIEADDAEIRFYAAEALAYLDEPRAAAPLAQAARDEPAFRVFALTALSAMDAVEAYDALSGLLTAASAETRYGAFRALWAMNARDPVIRGEVLGDQFSYHVLDVEGPPMIHVTRNYRAEVVLFGKDQRFRMPLALNAGKKIMINSTGDNRVVVSRYDVGQEDQRREVSNRVDEIIRAAVEVGATYPDVVQMLQEAKAARVLAGRFEVDSLPVAGRTYVRQKSGGKPDADQPESSEQQFVVTNPFPDLFAGLSDEEVDSRIEEESPPAEESDDPAAVARKPRIPLFGKMGSSR